MNKLILALMGLALAFAISSCCDQSYCPGNKKCKEMRERTLRARNHGQQEEAPYRWDSQGQQQQAPNQERQHRRW